MRIDPFSHQQLSLFKRARWVALYAQIAGRSLDSSQIFHQLKIHRLDGRRRIERSRGFALDKMAAENPPSDEKVVPDVITFFLIALLVEKMLFHLFQTRKYKNFPSRA